MLIPFGDCAWIDPSNVLSVHYDPLEKDDDESDEPDFVVVVASRVGDGIKLFEKYVKGEEVAKDLVNEFAARVNGYQGEFL